MDGTAPSRPPGPSLGGRSPAWGPLPFPNGCRTETCSRETLFPSSSPSFQKQLKGGCFLCSPGDPDANLKLTSPTVGATETNCSPPCSPLRSPGMGLPSSSHSWPGLCTHPKPWSGFSTVDLLSNKLRTDHSSWRWPQVGTRPVPWLVSLLPSSRPC